MQPLLLQPSWPSHNIQFSASPHTIFCGLYEDTYPRDSYALSSTVTTTDSSDSSFYSSFSALIPDTFTELTGLQNDSHISPLSGADIVIDHLEPSKFADFCQWLNNSPEPPKGDMWSPSLSVVSSEASIVLPSRNMPVMIPGNGMEVDRQLNLHHLLEAYAEATENRHKELAEVIVKCINGKVNPLGEAVERVAFNLFHLSEDQGCYLQNESSINFEAAFKAFYQILPYGRFAHFAANSTILEALPSYAETVNIVDFDMGEGIQWPPLIEAMGPKRISLKLISIKTEEESTSSRWRFKITQRRLHDHARQCGQKLQIEEMTIEELVTEMKRMKKSTGKQWLAFNCMFRLPHMAKKQQRSQAMEFLKIAKELLSYSATPSGIVVFADGESRGNGDSFPGYSSSFNNQLIHYKSLLESMEWHFPVNLAEARIALESLFLAPYICSTSWFHDWQENKIKGTSNIMAETGLQGRRISIENLIQAKVLVNERETAYEVKIEEQKQHEMILEWRGTPLMRVSTWM